MSRQEEFLFKLMRPSGFDKAQVALLVGAVNFVAHDWMADRREMHPNLMRAPGVRNRANHAESIA